MGMPVGSSFKFSCRDRSSSYVIRLYLILSNPLILLLLLLQLAQVFRRSVNEKHFEETV